MASKRIIILDKLPEANRYRYALWADVPPARQAFYAAPERASAWIGASAGDNAALAAGQVVERVDIISVAAGSTLAGIQAELQATWQKFQDEINNQNPWIRYGTTWDGSTWAVGGVA